MSRTPHDTHFHPTDIRLQLERIILSNVFFLLASVIFLCFIFFLFRGVIDTVSHARGDGEGIVDRRTSFTYRRVPSSHVRDIVTG